MPTIEDLAQILCSLRDMKRLEYTKCLDDGTVCLPAEIPCCGDKSFTLSQSDILSLMAAAGSDPCCPANLDLLEQILEAITDDAETGAYTTLCSSADPSITYLVWFEQPDEVGATVTPYHIILGDDTPIAGIPADGVPCQDNKVIDNCYFVPGDPDVYYTQVICLSGSTIISTLWVYPDGTISSVAPAGAQPCASEEIRTVKLPEICITLNGECFTGFLELVYNQNGTIYTRQVLDGEMNPTLFDSYKVGACNASIVPCYTCST